MQLDTSSLISLGSALVVVSSTIAVSRVMILNMKESLEEFKTWTREHIRTEKNHAMTIAEQRIVNIEKDVNEIFPRLRKVEDRTGENSICIKQIKKDCEKNHMVRGA
jgi:hypothetical protein